MTEARLEWCRSTIRQMELAGFEPTTILTSAFDKYVKGEISFYSLCAILRDEGE